MAAGYLFAILYAAVLAACSNGSGADFNGTVIVEWLNLTPGFDNAPE